MLDYFSIKLFEVYGKIDARQPSRALVKQEKNKLFFLVIPSINNQKYTYAQGTWCFLMAYP